MNIKNVLRSVFNPIISKYHDWIHKKPVVQNFEDVSVNVISGVYSPRIHKSTTIFLRYIKELNLNQKTILELGCGSGLIAAYCSVKGGIVTASDIDDTAVQELTIESRDNNWNIIAVYSDLFENLHFHFDYIFINPPIDCDVDASARGYGNFAGLNFEFFDRLFAQLKIRTLRDTEVIMYLPEEAEIFSICRRAKHHHLKLKTKKVLHEDGYTGTVYRVEAGD